jgi:hypothetical protein
MRRWSAKENDATRMEVEANKFSALMLMPPELRPVIERLPLCAVRAARPQLLISGSVGANRRGERDRFWGAQSHTLTPMTAAGRSAARQDKARNLEMRKLVFAILVLATILPLGATAQEECDPYSVCAVIGNSRNPRCWCWWDTWRGPGVAPSWWWMWRRTPGWRPGYQGGGMYHRPGINPWYR